MEVPEAAVTIKTKSICGAVNLLAAIFHEDANELKIKYGLPTAYHPCLHCRQLTDKRNPFCSNQCRCAYAHIKVVCDECGVIFDRLQGQLIYWIGKRNQKHVFCSRKCLGKFTARNYGFLAHPENRGKGGAKRKWDYEEVYRLRDETGWGSTKIGRTLGMPRPTIDMILRKRNSIQGLKEAL